MNVLTRLAASIGALLGRASKHAPDLKETMEAAGHGARVGANVGGVAGPTGQLVAGATGAVVGAVAAAMRGASAARAATDYEDAITRRIKDLEARAGELEEALERERKQTSDLIADNARLRASERVLAGLVKNRTAWLWFAWFVAFALAAMLACYLTGVWIARFV